MRNATRVVSWDGYTSDALARLCGVPHLELLAETDSTQNVAHDLAEKGGGDAAAGTVVLADAQRAGRGRLGRSWSSEPGRGVWCTIVERPIPGIATNVLSLRVGLYLAEAIDAFAHARVGVKWPNDLVLPVGVIPRSVATTDLHYVKLGGILVEARWTGASLAWVAIGVGVNVVAPSDMPGATGLKPGARRADVLVAIVRAVRRAAAAEGPLTNEELDRYRARDTLAGRRIVSPATGTVAGIAPTGSLVVETSRGSEHISAGTIQLAEEEQERNA